MARTVIDLSPEERRQYARTFQRLTRFANHAREEAAWHLAQEIAAVLRRDFAAHRVVVFGSLVASDALSDWSDVDVAVAGIAPECFFEAVGLVTGISPEFEVDLVDLERCRESLRAKIERTGREL